MEHLICIIFICNIKPACMLVEYRAYRRSSRDVLSQKTRSDKTFIRGTTPFHKSLIWHRFFVLPFRVILPKHSDLYMDIDEDKGGLVEEGEFKSYCKRKGKAPLDPDVTFLPLAPICFLGNNFGY